MTDDRSSRSHAKRNFWAFMLDYAFFGMAMSFVSTDSVLPTFVRSLTDSEPIVGLVGTVYTAGWLLPQLFGAAMMSGKPRKKPYVMAASYVARPLFLLLGLATWAGLPLYPNAMLAALFACLVLFTLMDGVASVGWFDILARAVPLSRRGRLLGVSQLASGLLGMAVGGLVGVILSNPALDFPNNYALLFALCSLTHVPALIALSSIQEPEIDGDSLAEEGGDPSLGALARRLGAVWKGDAGFRRLISARWFVGCMGLASCFYVLHATEVMGLPEVVTGWFVSARMAGGAVSSLLLGWVSDRYGPRRVVQLGAATAAASPILALMIHMVGSPVVARVYPLVFFFYGVTVNTTLLGPMNYLMEMAPAGQRPIYIGLANTLMGVLVPISFLGGVLLRVASYPILFAVTGVGVTAGLGVSLKLRDPGDKDFV